MSNDTQKQSQYDKMIKTPIPKLVVTLAIPTILSMMITSVYNMADTAFVGQLGNSASGAVGVVFGFMAVIQAVGFMFGQGAGSMIAMQLGKQDGDSAGAAASTGFFVALLTGILISVLGFLFLDPLVFFLGSTETIAPYAKTYMIFILLSAPFMVVCFVMNNILRYEGKAALGMIGLMTGGVLNIICDPIFMFGFRLGIAGAGLSTALSQCVSFCILLSMFLRGKTVTKLSVKRIMWNPLRILNLMATGLPSFLRQGLNSIATVLLNTQAALYGDAAVAAMSIVSRIAMFVLSIAIGVGQGFQPVSGFNYGAGKYRRVRRAYCFTFLLSEILIAVIAAGVMIFSGSMIQLFRDDAEVITIGIRALRLQCVSLLFVPFSMVTEMQLQSTGKKLGASTLSALRSGVFFIPALVIMARFRGLAGIQEAQPLAAVLSFLPAIFFAAWFFSHLPKEEDTNEDVQL